jgi:hypothetical protein
MRDSAFMYLVDSENIQPSLLLFIKMNQKLILFGSVIVVAFGAFIGVAWSQTDHEKACADLAQKSSLDIGDHNYRWAQCGVPHPWFGAGS